MRDRGAERKPLPVAVMRLAREWNARVAAKRINAAIKAWQRQRHEKKRPRR
jgi:hypothetical protein